MENLEKAKLEFYGGPLIGFLPTLIYIILAIVLAFQFNYYSINAVAYGGGIGLVLVSFLAKNQQNYWSTLASSLKSYIDNFVLFLFLGIFITFLTEGDLGGGMIWLGNLLGLQGGAFVVLSFLASALVTTGTGAPLMGLLTTLPLFYPAGIALGADQIILAGAILSGCFFGDHISPSSQVTIVSAGTQEDSETGKTAEPTKVIQNRSLYAIGAAVISAIAFYFLGSAGDGINDPAIVEDMSNGTGLWMLVALGLLLFVAFKTKNVLFAIVLGIVAAAIIGLFTGLYSLQDFLFFNAETGEMAGLIPDGISNLAPFLISLIFLYMMIETMKLSGAISVVSNWLAGFSFLQKPLGVELIITLFVMLVTVMLSGMVLPSILIISSLMDDLGEKADLSSERRTNVMILASSSIGAIIPVSSVFVNGMVGNISAMQNQYSFIQEISPFSAFFSSVYNWLMLIVLLIWIFSGLNRERNNEK